MTTKVGTIKIIFGCMWAGKTSEVIKEYKKWHSISRNAVCINFKDDNRYSEAEEVYSHDKNFVECVKVGKLEEVDPNIIMNGDIILINEGQFFSDLVKYSVMWCETYGKNIIVSGLDGDFERKPFGQMLDLIPYADTVKKLAAFCAKCADGTPAYFSKRLVSDKEQLLIGGDGDYCAVWRKHYCENNSVNIPIKY